MISEKLSLRVELSRDKVDENSFLVALIPALSLPAELPTLPGITDCAVIAANDENGNGVFSYVHLEADEKQFIGDCIAEACTPMNEWVWCNLFTETNKG